MYCAIFVKRPTLDKVLYSRCNGANPVINYCFVLLFQVEGQYEAILQQYAGQASIAVNQIELDLLRTLPTNKYYDKPDAQGVSQFMNIVLLYSQYLTYHELWLLSAPCYYVHPAIMHTPLLCVYYLLSICSLPHLNLHLISACAK